jgi:hypothetical protein
VIQLFWLSALGVLFLDRWPGGRGPAWEEAEAIEWPVPERFPQAESNEEEEEPEAVAAEPVSQRSPNARSRKRKRRG